MIKKCKFKNCNLKSYGKNYCKKHYYRIVRNGTTTPLYDLESYAKIDSMKDPRIGHRGTYAVNIINDIKYKAIQRGKKWGLNHADAFKLITTECHYCGFIPNWPNNRVGIDRVDNSKDYTVDNCLPCCFTCNTAKGQKTIPEFKEWIIKVFSFINK